MARILGSSIHDGEHHHHHHNTSSRREFLTQMGLVATGSALMLGSSPVQALASNGFFKKLAGLEGDKILVLIQLDGGNDGLNTVIPFENDFYYQARPTLGIAKSDTLHISDSLGLHSNLEALLPLWDAGKMGIIQNVGYPEANLSHFRSTDIWLSGSDSDELVETGWLGRQLGSEYPGFIDNPTEYPLAVQIGGASSLLFTGPEVGMGMTLPDLEQLERLVQDGAVYSLDGFDESLLSEEVKFLRRQANNSYRYADKIKSAYEASSNKAEFQDDTIGRLGASLAIVSRLIKGNLGTKIYLVSLGQFDTHAKQPDVHPELMRNVSNAISAFYNDLSADNRSNEVLISTFSEFGRRVGQNFSDGTDHGTSAPMFVIGDAVNGGLFGSDPKLAPNELDKYGNMIHEHEFRQVYATLLDDWFGLEPSLTQDVLGGEFQKIGFLDATFTSVQEQRAVPRTFSLKQNFPNPFNPSTTISFSIPERNFVSIEIFDIQGRKMANLVNKILAAGEHKITFFADQFASGTYIYRLRFNDQVLSKTMTLIK